MASDIESVSVRRVVSWHSAVESLQRDVSRMSQQRVGVPGAPAARDTGDLFEKDFNNAAYPGDLSPGFVAGRDCVLLVQWLVAKGSLLAADDLGVQGCV